MVENDEWTNWMNGSGILPNQRKRLLLKLAADVRKDVNSQRDKIGVLISRKAMIQCRFAYNLNRIWEDK